MYDKSFRNQAVKECVNGQSLRGTAKKYGISEATLRAWIKEYKKRMAEISGSEYKIKTETKLFIYRMQQVHLPQLEKDVFIRYPAEIPRKKDDNIFTEIKQKFLVTETIQQDIIDFLSIVSANLIWSKPKTLPYSQLGFQFGICNPILAQNLCACGSLPPTYRMCGYYCMSNRDLPTKL